MRLSFKRRADIKPIKHKPSRHRRITFVGDAGKHWRKLALAAAAVVLIIVLIVTLREEPALMSSAEIGSVKDRGVLKVGIRSDIPGLSDENGGLENELALLLATRILPERTDGDAVQYVEVNNMTVAPKLDDGTIDVACAMMQKDARTDYAYSQAYYTDTMRLVTLPGKETLTLAGRTVGYIQSTSEYKSPGETMAKAYADSEEHANMGIEVKGFATYPDMLEALNAGTVHAVAMTDIMMEKFCAEMNVTTYAETLGTVEYAFACTQETASLVSVADLMIEEMRTSGALTRLYIKYGLG